MKKYPTNYDRDAINHWSNYEAVREFVQNMLDEGDYEFEVGEDYLTLCNKGVQVSNAMLKTGKSDKKGDTSKRGNYGTGSVFAMCILTARGISVSITNHDVVWLPMFEHSEVFGDEVMVVEEVPCTPTGNFTVNISGLSGADMSDIKQTNLIFQDREVLISTEYGDIIESVDDQGELYCGDLFVQQTPRFKYSYNIKPEYLTLNQDRQSISEFDLQRVTAKLIMSSENEELIREAIDAKCLDTTYVVYGYGDVPEYLAEEYAQDFVDENEATLITNDYTEHQVNIVNNVPSVYVDNEIKVKAIQSSTLYQDSIEDLELIEKQTVNEIMEEFSEKLMDYLHTNNISIEYCSEIKVMLESVVEQSEGWDGDTSELPF